MWGYLHPSTSKTQTVFDGWISSCMTYVLIGAWLFQSNVHMQLVIFKGSIFHEFALISKFKDAIFMNFCYGQYMYLV